MFGNKKLSFIVPIAIALLMYMLFILFGRAEDKIDFTEDVIVVLDGIQDPGNLGTILRTIDSVGLTQVVVSKKSGDVFNPKVVRSTMGAIFRINIIQSENLVNTLKEIKKHKKSALSVAQLKKMSYTCTGFRILKFERYVYYNKEERSCQF